MVSIAMLVIMAGCAAYLFLKGTLVLGVTMVFNALIAGFAAFGFFELLAKYLVKYSPGIAVWAPMICFLLLFILVFAILQAVAMQISKEKIDFGKLPEQIGRPVAGVILGYIVTGHVLVAAAMAPLPSQYPYARFEGRNPNPSNPSKTLLSPDGFVTSLFGSVSAGSFSPMGEPKSFAVVHAGFVDRLYLNRLGGKDAPLMTETEALKVPTRDGVWEAPENLRDAENKPVPSQAGRNLMLVRVEIRKAALKDAGKFTLSQFRLVCSPKTAAGAMAGKGEAVYPAGYIGVGNRLQAKPLGEVISIDASKVSGDTLTIDLAFHVPTGLTPTLIEFKRNNIAKVSVVASSEDAPQPVPFGASAPQPQPQAAPEPDAQPQVEEEARPEQSDSANRPRQRRGLSDVSRSVTGDVGEEN
jgi:uncharacterized integral membrane protein